VFASPERSQVFDINDFDETLPGPFEWDLKRLATSFEIAGRHRGFDHFERLAAVVQCVRFYRDAMARFAAMRNLDVWYAHLEASDILERLTADAKTAEAKRLERDIAKARSRDSHLAYSKLTRIVDGEPRIASDPRLVVTADELLEGEARERYIEVIGTFLTLYRESLPEDRRSLLEGHRYVQIARKVVGVGSVGTRAWIVLMLGPGEDDARFLQLKEAQASAPNPMRERAPSTITGGEWSRVSA